MPTDGPHSHCCCVCCSSQSMLAVAHLEQQSSRSREEIGGPHGTRDVCSDSSFCVRGMEREKSGCRLSTRAVSVVSDNRSSRNQIEASGGEWRLWTWPPCRPSRRLERRGGPGPLRITGRLHKVTRGFDRSGGVEGRGAACLLGYIAVRRPQQHGCTAQLCAARPRGV